ncbi:DMT family transporter, partial [Phenylobacterium sp.]|uniref:DMT family transporter n=1 Tax=Phenylobacterium sp. TaxID=1871053 RepID=UPI002733674B
GITFRLAAVVAFGFMAVLVKLCAERGVNTFEIVFFRNAFAFIPIVITIMSSGGFGMLRTSRPGAHAIRSIVGVTGMVCGFAAMGMLPLTEFTAIMFCTPLVVTALSAPVLREKVSGHQWGAVIVGFCGMLMLVRPDPAHMASIGVALALLQVAGGAGAMLAIRQLGSTESGPTIAFYFTVAATLVGLVALPFVWTTPDPLTLLYLVLMGVAGGIGQLMLTQAYRLAPAAIVAPFDYATLLWNGLLGFLVWNELPRVTTVIGGLVVMASGLYVILRETRKPSAT